MTQAVSRARAARRRRLWAAARRAGWKGVLLTPGLGAARGTHDGPSPRAPHDGLSPRAPQDGFSPRAPHRPTDAAPDERNPS
ncbi:hypothetical protein [Streptomyces cellulosae]|uniref:hypothetical protein n=1 Tax=Streptomyces cellulosae TaxID=1968 RepID=UPI0004C53E05|nr:hypothetical protein [Streptomyces cellulosae]